MTRQELLAAYSEHVVEDGFDLSQASEEEIEEFIGDFLDSLDE